MSLYRRGGVWWYKFRFQSVVIRESTGLANKEAAREVERKRHTALREGSAGIVRPKRVGLFSTAAEDWIRCKRAAWKTKTNVIVKTNLSHLTPVFGTRLLSDIGVDDVIDYREQRLGEGASPKTVSLELATLRTTMLYHGLDGCWRAIKDKVKLAKARKVGRVITVAEEMALLRECQASRSRSLPIAVTLAFESAMRYSELRLLQWRNVDLVRKVVTVGQSKTAAGTGREIPLTTRAEDVLSAWALNFPKRKPNHFVFPSENYGQKKSDSTQNSVAYNTDPSQPISTWKEGWEHAKLRAGVECRFHDLRHTACTRLLEAGVHSSTIAEIMGWSASTATYMMREVYGHVSPKVRRSAMDQLDHYMSQQRGAQERAQSEVEPKGMIQ